MAKENPQLSRGLDYYKATMSQVEHIKLAETQVTFELKNRTTDRQLSQYVSANELQTKLNNYRQGWQTNELAYLASINNQDGQAQFSQDYLYFLAENQLPPIDVGYDDDGEITVTTTGPAPLVTFWETIVMSEINEIYFSNLLAEQGKSLEDLYAEGDRRLSEKIAILKERPDIKISDFGTRRRFSYAWHRHVVERLAKELPDNFLGTSNIYLAHELGLKPIGTFAHELPMIYAAKADIETGDPLSGHGKMLDDWYTLNRGDLSTALTDTFTSEYFFHNFTKKQAEQWSALRHDSGDPIDFGNRVIDFYEQHGINFTTKTVIFSDSLTIDSIVKLADYFDGAFNIIFGWGTALTNDLGLDPISDVMKAVRVDGISTVKLSDDKGKHTGTPEKILQYEQHRRQALGKIALDTI